MAISANVALIKFLCANLGLSAEGSEVELARKELLTLSGVSRRQHIDHTLVVEKLAEKMGVAWLALFDHDTRLDVEAVRELIELTGPEECRKRLLLPFERSASTVRVAMTNPFDIEARQSLEFVLGKPVSVVAADEDEIRSLIATCAPAPLDASDSENDGDESVEVVYSPLDQSHDVDAFDEPDTPTVVKVTNHILLDAVERRASDIHIEPVEAGLVVRFRVDGNLIEARMLSKEIRARVIARFKILCGMDIAERRKPQDGRMRIRVRSQPIDIRASAVPTAHGESLVLRLLSIRWDELSLKRLGMPVAAETQLLEALKSESGLILVTGPTGSGKTTTLYACLLHLRDGTSNIVTVEDPVEYRLKGLNQIQIHEAVGVTFAAALRSVLRQDPDVILLGEIRDEETARIAVQAAQTGHLVLATLHTRDATGAIARLVDLGVDQLSLSEVLRGVLAQRLVRTVCPKCAKPPSAESRDLYRADRSIAQCGVPFDDVVEAVGCRACHGAGYHGRTGVYSFLRFTPALARLLLEGADPSALRNAAIRGGYQPTESAALQLVKERRTTLTEIRPFLMENDPGEVQKPSTTVAITDQDLSERSFVASGPSLGVLLIDSNEHRRRIIADALTHHHLKIHPLSAIPESAETFSDIDVIVCDGELLLDPQRHIPVSKSSGGSVPIVGLATQSMSRASTDVLRGRCATVVQTSQSASALAAIIRSVGVTEKKA